MTQSAKIITATIFLIVTLSTNTFAQQLDTEDSSATVYAKNIVAFEADDGGNTAVEANSKMETSFSDLFPNATTRQWYVSADNYWVSFLNNGRKANASFTLEGKMNYIITNCAMENLPIAFSKSIKKDYASYHLFNAKEITTHGTVAYQAILEDSKGYITLKYISEGVKEIHQVKKQ